MQLKKKKKKKKTKNSEDICSQETAFKGEQGEMSQFQ